MSTPAHGPAPRSAPTMADVAAHAGVSPMTVSRTLHDDPRVSPSTRSKVLASVDQLGYRRNENARSLRVGHSTKLLGLIVTNLANPFYSRLAMGVEAVAAEHGMTVLLGTTAEDVKREKDLVESLASRQVSGMIVVPAGSDHAHLRADRLDGTPVVLAARPPVGAGLDCVLVDDFGGAKAATDALASAGHERIGFLGLHPNRWTSAERFRGFSTALAESRLPVDERYVRLSLHGPGAAERAAGELLALPDPPTALFAANNRNTLAAIRAVIAAGTGTGSGSSTALAGFDDIELADILGISLTVVAYDPAELGRQAARLLVERIALRPETTLVSPRRVVVPTALTHYGPSARRVGEP